FMVVAHPGPFGIGAGAGGAVCGAFGFPLGTLQFVCAAHFRAVTQNLDLAGHFGLPGFAIRYLLLSSGQSVAGLVMRFAGCARRGAGLIDLRFGLAQVTRPAPGENAGVTAVAVVE